MRQTHRVTRKRLSDAKRSQRLAYNADYDDKKRVAKRLGLLRKGSLKLVKPRGMSESKFNSLVKRYSLI